MPTNSPAMAAELHPLRWPKKAHPGALSQAGRERAPWLTRWARATFEQGCLSALPHLEGPCEALFPPGEHLFQASRILLDRLRPVIFHAFAKRSMMHRRSSINLHSSDGTLSIALLGMQQVLVADKANCHAGSPVALAGPLIRTPKSPGTATDLEKKLQAQLQAPQPAWPIMLLRHNCGEMARACRQRCCTDAGTLATK